MHAKNLAILFTDIEGYTAKSATGSRHDILTLLRKNEQITKSSIEAYGGKIIKNLGDGFLISFTSPTNAVLAGREIQLRIHEYNLKAPPNRKFRLKIAVASGDVMAKNNDVFGDAVNLASRILNITTPGSVFLASSVYLAMNRNEINMINLGEHRFKGIAHKVRIYKVAGKQDMAYQFARAKRIVLDNIIVRNWRYILALALFLYLVSLYLSVVWVQEESAGEEQTQSPITTPSVRQTPMASPSPTLAPTIAPQDTPPPEPEKTNDPGPPIVPPGQEKKEN